MVLFEMRGVVVAALLLLAYPICKIIYNLYFHPLAKVPGPRIWAATRLPYIRALIQGTIVHDFEKLHQVYGPVIRIAPDEVTFAQGEAYNDIFRIRQGHRQFLKDPIWWSRQPGQPNSILSAIEPESHARIRKILAPAFTTRALKAQEPLVQKYVNLLIERMHDKAAEAKNGQNGVEFDIGPWFNFTTFDIFGELGFGESFDCLQNSRYHPWIALLFNSVKAASFISATKFFPLVTFLLMKCIPESLKKMQKDHFQQIVDKVDRRLSWELDRPDFMSHVIKADGGTKMPMGEVYATFMVMTTAGSETTATTLSGTMNHLVAQPDILAKLTEEVRSAFMSESEMNLEALQGLQYLNAVLREGLRLCPPVPWMLPRVVPPGGDTVCGTWLPGGTTVSIQAYTLNRDPSYFHSATTFTPERWLPEASTNPKSPYFRDQRSAVQPFSVGPRECIGQHLAWAELRLILARLVWAFDFEAAGEKKLKWEELRTFLLVEKKPIDVRIKRRSE
ncbi:benzoate 4-monooxygenase cytochrome P450 [Arthroderma uncinatum]|uniref:benzoate 4-monooxygenase cytochrome P450 n=1 Tax=Arthroderma uncinatum TaxID=74035 RepID=UPI00144A67A5|nr:benzoate 4-monooxygenase cytochrome P450 [Arthroderma uncinatum]KAF3482729.1 benzoate 4-monooxygenase cytochrome P450 [Arthroderma uncinatum]